jgi:hypothetical protein
LRNKIAALLILSIIIIGFAVASDIVNAASPNYNLKVATQTFSPWSGTYFSTQFVSIYCSTLGATIHYTTNGSPASSTSPTYTKPITVSTSMTINAIALKNGYVASNTASATYTIPIPFKSFTLTASGTAKDTKTSKPVVVTLSLSGSTDGSLQTIINLNVKGGDFKVAGYNDITVSSGSGYIISLCRYNQFSLIIGGQYGGQVTYLLLTGTVTPVSSNTLSLSLSSNIVVLPFQGYPVLKNLQLTDTTTFYT